MSRRERGQMLIIFALLVVPISLVVGVVAVDASMWQSERRGAQKDADLAALAGAYELLAPTPDAAVIAAAKTKAASYGDINDESGNASLIGDIVVDASCFGGGTRPDSVKLNIDHDSRTFFASAFGVGVPEIGAHARACAGSIVARKGLRPYGIESAPICAGASANPFMDGAAPKLASLNLAPKTDTPTPTRTSTPTRTNTPTVTNTPGGNTATPTNTPGGVPPTATPTAGGPTATSTATGGCRPPADSDCFVANGSGLMIPKFGAWCQLDDGSQDPSTSKRGLLDLALTGNVCSDGGKDDIEPNIQDGSGATCRIGDTVIATTGARPGQDINKGIQVLLAGGGTPPVADGADCDVKFGVPGGVDHPGIDDFEEVLQRTDGGTGGPSPNATYQFRECVSPRVIDIIVIGNFASDPTIKAFAGFYILGCKLDTDTRPLTTILPNKCTTGAPGHLQLWGIFFQKLELGGDIGEYNLYGENGIALNE